MARNAKANDFIVLKDRVKKEVLRRKFTGSVENYGGADYDYKTMPRHGSPISTEHINKIVTPLKAINSEGIYSEKPNGGSIQDIDILEARVAVLEVKPITGEDHGCSGSCSGLCSTTCSGTCTEGCSSTCQGCTGCGGACSSGCTGCGSCSGCGGSCSRSCSGTCSGCSGSCGGSCGGCSGCMNSCTGCSGCGGSCSGSSC